jgi:two-component system sensor histidine kinase KdpD
VIDEESDRLNRFIEGLSTSGEAAPVQPIHLRAIEIDELLRSGLSRAETVTRDHHVVVSIDEAVPAVSVDAASITEVIYILLDNASKYAPAGTAITIEAAREDDHSVRIAVSDEGPGIPDHLRERVFERFFRIPARESHDPNRGGVGLGLPIARRLIETQGGRIWIETTGSGTGTAVIMTLPAADSELRTENLELRTEAAVTPSTLSTLSAPRTLSTESTPRTLRTERTA